MFCKTHVLLSKIIEFHNNGYKLKSLFDTYSRYSGLVFQSESYNSFCNKINKIKKEGSIEKVLIHGLTKLPSNNLKKEEDVIYEILRNYGDGKKPNAQTVLEKTNEYLIRTNRKTISISSIYNVISQAYVKNESTLIRHGLKYVENNILPYSHFDPPSDLGMLWVMDGTRFQFAYINENNKYNFLTYFVVMEAFNRKIIGYSYDVSENSTMVYNALAYACKETNILPREILSDKSSAFKTEDLIRIQALAKTWGCNWCKIHDPRDNSYVERFFGVFQETVCKKYDGYLGDGIRSKYLDGKPSPEEIKKYLRYKNLKSKDEVIELLDSLIMEYNNSKTGIMTNFADVKLSNENQRSKITPIYLDTIKYAQLFWSDKTLIVRHSEISFEINNRRFAYQIFDIELVLKLNGNHVKVLYNPDNLNIILVFDIKSGTYLCTLDRYVNIPKASVERTQDQNKELYKSVTKKKGLVKELKNKINTIVEISDANREKLPPKLVEFNIGKKYQIEEAENTLLNEELVKITGEDEINETDYDLKFNELYFQKGDLKRFQPENN